MPGRDISEHLPNSIRWASACTGSAGDLLVAQAISKGINDLLDSGSMRIDYLFSCDIRPQNQRWAMQVHNFVHKQQEARREAEGFAQLNCERPCIFADIRSLSQSTCVCLEHSTSTTEVRCPVPSADIFVCCTSCKDLSRSLHQPAHAVLSEKESREGSAQTLCGLMDYIDAHRPGVVIWENVDSVETEVPDLKNSSSSKHSNLDLSLAEFGSRNYECQVAAVNATQFGIPQNRRRVLVVAILTVAPHRSHSMTVGCVRCSKRFDL